MSPEASHFGSDWLLTLGEKKRIAKEGKELGTYSRKNLGTPVVITMVS